MKENKKIITASKKYNDNVKLIILSYQLDAVKIKINVPLRYQGY